MKKFTFCFFLLISVMANATNYFTAGTTWLKEVIPDEPWSANALVKVWLEPSSSEDFPDRLEMFYETINKENSKKFIAYIKADGEKVYFSIPTDPDTWYLMYDFGLQPGEGCRIWQFYNIFNKNGVWDLKSAFVKCAEISEPERFGGWETMTLEMYRDESCEGNFSTAYWLKNLSSYAGVENSLYNDSMVGGGVNLLEVSNNGEIIWRSPKYHGIAEYYLTDGITWTMVYHGDEPEIVNWFGKYYLSKNDEADYFNLYKANSENDIFIVYIKPEGDKVYFSTFTDPDTWYLMYDFGLQPGEGCTIYYFYNRKGNSDIWEIGTTYFKCREITNPEKFNGWETMEMDDYLNHPDEEASGFSSWLKGLGSIYGFSFNNDSTVWVGRSQQVIEVSKGDIVIWKLPAYAGLSDVSESGKNEIKDNRIYDLNGRILNSENLTPGIYIKNGKKFVVKK